MTTTRSPQDRLAELERSHARLVAMVANISDTITLVDADGNVLSTSGLHTSVLGHDAEFWQERSIFDLISDDDVPRMLAARNAVLAAPGAPVTTEVRVRDAEGVWQDIELTAVNLLDDPDVGGIVITSRNISHRKIVEAALARRRDEAEEEARLRTEFVARVSHELRNQVHALQGLTELVGRSDAPRSVRDLAATAQHQAEALKHLVDDLLQLSRVDLGGAVADVGAARVDRLLADAAAVATAAAASDVSVRSGVGPEVPEVIEVAVAPMRQVLANLAGNAAKFTSSGHVELRVAADTTADGTVLRWTVADTGPGIAPEDQHRIWEPFGRGTGTAHVPGTGLGLAITARAVERLGGRVSLESQVGTGTTFTVSVPVSVPATTGETAATGRAVHPLPLGTTVLVVEDNPVNQLLVQEQLEALGADAVVVGDGAEALGAVAAHPELSCVLMDWHLPVVDGLVATRRLRAGEEHGRHLVVIGMTASALPGDRQRCLDAGMDDLVVKPVGLADLHDVLRRWLGDGDTDDLDDVTAAVPDDRQEGWFDPTALDRLAVELGSVDPVRSVARAYLGELTARRDRLVGAAHADDLDEVHRVAHTLRATSRTLGAAGVDRTCELLDGAPGPIPEELLGRFEASVAATITGLTAWLGATTSR